MKKADYRMEMSIKAGSPDDTTVIINSAADNFMMCLHGQFRVKPRS